MTRTEPDDLPADHGTDEQAETLAETDAPQEQARTVRPFAGRNYRDLSEEERRELRTPDPLTGAALPTEPPTPEQAAAEQAAVDVPVVEGEVQADRAPERAGLPVLFANVASGLVDGIAPEHLDAVTKQLKPGLIDAVRERVRQVRSVRPPVVTDSDVFPLVRQLTYAEEVLRRIGTAWTGAADECRAIAGEELLTAKGEQDGVPTGRLIVPDGDGTEIVVKAKTTRAPDTFDVSGIVGVVGDQASRTVFDGGCACDTNPETMDGPNALCPEHGNPRDLAAAAARESAAFVLTLLSSPKWATTKLDAFSRALSAAGHDGDAGVLQQARVRGAEQWNGATEVVREQAKTRRRS